MKKIIKDARIVEDDWQILDGSEASWLEVSRAGGGKIVPLKTYLAHLPARAGRGERMAVLLGPEDAPESVAPYLPGLTLVAVHFPTFADGRGYSTGRLLRTRYGFTGEMRAVGDILRDQLYFLGRCGFNSFELRNDQDLNGALTAFRDYAWQPNTAVMAATAKK